MLTIIIVVAALALAGFVAMKTGKVKDENNNNIPDFIEKKVEKITESPVAKELQEVTQKIEVAAQKPVVAKKVTKPTQTSVKEGQNPNKKQNKK